MAGEAKDTDPKPGAGAAARAAERPGLTLAAAPALGIVGRPETGCWGEVGMTAEGWQGNGNLLVSPESLPMP